MDQKGNRALALMDKELHISQLRGAAGKGRVTFLWECSTGEWVTWVTLPYQTTHPRIHGAYLKKAHLWVGRAGGWDGDNQNLLHGILKTLNEFLFFRMLSECSTTDEIPMSASVTARLSMHYWGGRDRWAGWLWDSDLHTWHSCHTHEHTEACSHPPKKKLAKHPSMACWGRVTLLWGGMIMGKLSVLPQWKTLHTCAYGKQWLDGRGTCMRSGG